MRVYLSEALRILLRKLRAEFKGIKKYEGSDETICTNIIRDCYNHENNYFMVSNGHFSEFYARDFGWCVHALLRLGYRKEVINTLEYALMAYKRHGTIEQAISPRGKAFTFPHTYSPDALAFIIRSLKLARATTLVKKHKVFLEQEIRRYYNTVINKATGLVRKDKLFSSMRDYAIRQSSCYDNVMTGMLANDLKELGVLINPFKKYDYKRILIENFWTGRYFLNDLSGDRSVVGDANVLPFWSGLITDKKMLRKTINTITAEGLDNPFPLKYARSRFKEHRMILLDFLVRNYQTDSVWAHLGMMYIEVLARINKKLAQKHLCQYKRLVEKHKNFLEVYDAEGRLFKSLFYYADEGMLWAANYLHLRRLLLQNV